MSCLILSIFCHMKFFDPQDSSLVLELLFLKTLSGLAFKALNMTSKHVWEPLFNLYKSENPSYKDLALQWPLWP